MSGIAVIGSCITRDLWPIVGEAPPQGLFYVSRTSLPSLLSAPPADVSLPAEDQTGPGGFPKRAMTSDLRKTALGELVARRPSHIVFDFIDERADLLQTGGAYVTRTWELCVSGHLEHPALQAGQPIARTAPGCELIWRMALRELAALIGATPLRDAQLILHEAQWATQYRDAEGAVHDFPAEIELFSGSWADIRAHNQVLRAYQQAFLDAFPQATRVGAPATLTVADQSHRWGLSPFHYIREYYEYVLPRLQALGV